MKAFIFATNNIHKVNEVRAVLGNRFEINSLAEAGINIEIPEPHATLEANALEKSKTIFELTGKNCFSEDTGLEVDALNGEPGVRSARYAGETRNFNENIIKLLSELAPHQDKKARFRTVISLILEGKQYLFEGICDGEIINIQRGDNGFGYDPIFIPDGANCTFAEMSMNEKNKYSHRKKAMEKLIYFLNTQHVQN